MRIECPQCQTLFDVESAELNAGEVRISCTSCEASLSLPLAPKAKAEAKAEAKTESPAASGLVCPKCSARVDAGVNACNSCGLSTALFADFEHDGLGEDHELEDAWQQVCEEWSSDERHEDFMKLVASSGDYRIAALCYRGSAADAAHSQRSEQMLKRIHSMASVALLSTRPKIAAEREPFRGVVILLIALIFLAGAIGMYFIFKSKSPRAGKRYPGSSRSQPAATPKAPSSRAPAKPPVKSPAKPPQK